MKCCLPPSFPLFLCAAGLCAGQATQPAASVNGRALSAAEANAIIAELPAAEQADKKTALRSYAVRELLTKAALADKLDEKWPYREDLRIQRTILLAQHILAQWAAQVDVSTALLERYYREHQLELERVRFRYIYLAFPPDKNAKSGRDEEQTKALAAELRKKLDAGADFVKLVQEYSDAPTSRARGGEYPPTLRQNDKLSKQMLETVFTTGAGQTAGPLREGTAYLLLRVDEHANGTFADARAEVQEIVQRQGFRARSAEFKKTVALTLDDPEYFNSIRTRPESPFTAPNEKKIATLNGRAVTAGEVERILYALPDNVRTAASGDRQLALQQYGLYEKLAALAEREGQDKQNSLQQRLAIARLSLLAQAQVDQASNAIPVTLEMQRKHYEEHKDEFTEIKVRGIYIPFATVKLNGVNFDLKPPLTPEQARAKILELAKQARSGADFAKLAAANSEDPNTKDKGGDFGTVKKSDALPDLVKTALFALKAGEISEPIEQPNGYYLFRVEENQVVPFEKVRDNIYLQIQQAGLQRYLEKVNQEAIVSITDPAFLAAQPAQK